MTRGAGVGVDLVRAGATCRLLRDAAREEAPGLRCRLFPHQRDALRALVAREAGGAGGAGGEGNLVGCCNLKPVLVAPGFSAAGNNFDMFSSSYAFNSKLRPFNLAPHPALRRIVVQREREDGASEPAMEAWLLTAEIRDGAYFPGALHAGPRPPAMYADVRGRGLHSFTF